MHKFRKVTICLGAAILLFACHPRMATQIPEPENRAERLLAKLLDRNEGLETFKGLGEIRLWHDAGRQTARIAWLAAMDGRMRAEILGPSGRPLMKLAYDGQSFFLYSAGEEGIRKRRVRNPDLERAVHVPVTIRELIFFLGGRLPVYEYRDVQLVTSGGREPDRLIIKGDWRGFRQQVVLAPGHERVRAFRIYEDEDLRYQVELADYQAHGGFLIPSRIRISNGASEGFEIRMTRFWPNAGLRARQFVIEAP